MHATASAVLRFLALLSSGKAESMQASEKCDRSLLSCYLIVSRLCLAGFVLRFGMFRIRGVASALRQDTI